MKIPRSILKLKESFERLPGIGPKTAQRLTFYLLNFPQEELEKFASSLTELKQTTKLCSICKNVSEADICSVCSDGLRDARQIMVVTSPLDTFAMEKTGYKGVYHVLHGVIDPLNSIGPEELYIHDLFPRIQKLRDESSDQNVEIILATNTTMEGESTAMYISKMLRDRGYTSENLKITRIARGLPVGGDIEYADDITLSRALDGRMDF